MRVGKKHQPYFRIVACEKEAPPKAHFLEILGSYNPVKHEFVIDKEKLEKWLKNGAQPSNTMNNLLVKEGIFPKTKLIKKTVKPKKKAKEQKSESFDAAQDKRKPEVVETPKAEDQPKAGLPGAETPIETAKEEAEEKPFDSAQGKSKKPVEKEQKSEKEDQPKAGPRPPRGAAPRAEKPVKEKKEKSPAKQDQPKAEKTEKPEKRKDSKTHSTNSGQATLSG